MTYRQVQELTNESLTQHIIPREQLIEAAFRSMINVMLKQMTLQELSLLFGCYVCDENWAKHVLQESKPFTTSRELAERILSNKFILLETIVRLS